jgi:hypothetical protein
MSLIEDLVVSYRTLAAEGVIDAYGHVSVRSERDPGRYLMARQLAPELVTEADILEFDLDSKPIDPRDRKFYNERYIHGEIYKARPDVMAVVHNHAPAVVPFSCTSRATLKPIFHMSAFIGLGVPNWDIRDAQAGGVAREEARQVPGGAHARARLDLRGRKPPARGRAQRLPGIERPHAVPGDRAGGTARQDQLHGREGSRGERFLAELRPLVEFVAHSCPRQTQGRESMIRES